MPKPGGPSPPALAPRALVVAAGSQYPTAATSTPAAKPPRTVRPRNSGARSLVRASTESTAGTVIVELPWDLSTPRGGPNSQLSLSGLPCVGVHPDRTFPCESWPGHNDALTASPSQAIPAGWTSGSSGVRVPQVDRFARGLVKFFPAQILNFPTVRQTNSLRHGGGFRIGHLSSRRCQAVGLQRQCSDRSALAPSGKRHSCSSRKTSPRHRPGSSPVAIRQNSLVGDCAALLPSAGSSRRRPAKHRRLAAGWSAGLNKSVVGNGEPGLRGHGENIGRCDPVRLTRGRTPEALSRGFLAVATQWLQRSRRGSKSGRRGGGPRWVRPAASGISAMRSSSCPLGRVRGCRLRAFDPMTMVRG